VISGFRRKLDEIISLLSYHAASSGNLLQTFRDYLSVPSSDSIQGWISTPEDGKDRLSQNVGKKLPLLAL